MSNPNIRSDSGPRHKQIAHALRGQIFSGKYRVGDRLPTEEELAVLFHTSRPTLRQALGALVSEGLIFRRPRTGSVVVATKPPEALSHTVTSVEQLLDYPGETVRKMLGSQFIKADHELAEVLRCEPGKEWLHISSIRSPGRSDLPLCWTDIYVVPRYADVVKHKKHDKIPVFRQIIEMYGETVEQANIEVYACPVPAAIAGALKVLPDSPGLVVMRSYRGENGETFEVTVSIHPHDRYRYQFEFRKHTRAG